MPNLPMFAGYTKEQWDEMRQRQMLEDMIDWDDITRDTDEKAVSITIEAQDCLSGELIRIRDALKELSDSKGINDQSRQ